MFSIFRKKKVIRKKGKKSKRSYPKRYIPKRLTKKDKRKQRKEINKSRKAYKKGKYYTRKKVKSFKSKESPHITKAKKMYKINTISASSNLAKKTKCSVGALSKIVKKGQGAYYSSGSRPNQTGHSWGRARLASSITGGKAAAVDFKILEAGCKPDSKALRLAKSSKRRNGYGTRRVPKYKGGRPEEDNNNDDVDSLDGRDPAVNTSIARVDSLDGRDPAALARVDSQATSVLSDDDVPFDAAAAAAVDREHDSGDESADEAYIEPTRDNQAYQNIREFIESYPAVLYSPYAVRSTMNLDQQKELIQEKMGRVVRENIPILRDSSNESYRNVANTVEQSYRRLLEQIEEQNKALYRMNQNGGYSSDDEYDNNDDVPRRAGGPLLSKMRAQGSELSDEEDDNNDDVPFEAQALQAEGYIEGETDLVLSRENQAFQNLREFIDSLPADAGGDLAESTIDFESFSRLLATMNLDQQRELIQEQMGRVVREDIPILRDSSNEYVRNVANSFEQTFRRLLGGIEDRITASSDELPFEAQALQAEGYIEGETDLVLSRENQAFQNLREFIDSLPADAGGDLAESTIDFESFSRLLATMNLDQQRELIQEQMGRVVREDIPILRDSSNQYYRNVANSFEQTYRRLLEQIEERIEASSTAPLPGGGLKMKEKIIKFERGPGKKKYTAYLKNNKTKKRRVLHFGHKDYQQFKDRTPNKLYSSKNHGDKHRQENYYNRHSGEKNRTKAIQKEIRKGKGFYTPKILSHKYLW